MKQMLFLHLLFFFAFAAEAKVVKKTILHRDKERSFLIEQIDGTHPKALIIAFHGGGESGEEFRGKISNFTKLALSQNFGIVFPDGYNRSWEDGRQQKESGADDLGFIKKLIAALVADFHLAKGKVFALGYSNGGGFIYRLGCEMPELVRASAVVAMNMANDLSKKCFPSAPFPLMIITADNDPVVPMGGGEVINFGARLGTVLSADATEAFWTKHNGENIPVVRKIVHGGHEWPAPSPSLPGLSFLKKLLFNSNSFETDQEILQFFLNADEKK